MPSPSSHTPLPRYGLSIDETGKILDVGETFELIVGRERTALIGTLLIDLVSPDDRPREAEQAALRRGGFPTMYELALRRPDGAERLVQVSAVPRTDPSGGPTLDHFLFRDITPFSDRDVDAHSRNASFRRALEAMPLGIAVYGIDGELTFVNEAAALMLGADRREDLVGRSLRDIIPPENLELIAKRQSARRLGYETEPVELELRRFDGARRTVRGHTIFLSTEPIELLTVFDDVTARNQMEAALRESETRYRELFDSSPDAIFWVRAEALDQGHRFVVERANPACERFIRLPRASMEGRRIEEFLLPERAAIALHVLRTCVDTQRPMTLEQEIPGSKRHRSMAMTVVPVLASDGRVERLFGLARDVTEIRQQEAVLRQAQKLESLGVLAGGIAHDFNNLLTAIVGNLHLARRGLPDDSPSLPRLENISIAAQRAADLTRQMLAYSGRGKLVVTTIDVNVLVHEISHLLSVSISKMASLRCDLDPASPRIKADPAQLQQVVMNLVTNASDAIGDAPGTIVLTTRFVTLDHDQIASVLPNQAVSAGHFAAIEVTDDGCGMSAETLARIFDPFFTTKEKGRGLGLSAMQGILRGHRAGISISSLPGKGSTFRVFFPVADAAPTVSSRPPMSSVVDIEKGRGRILLVDDEPAVRTVASLLLRDLGFEIVEAADGVEALETFKRDESGFSLVVMDLTMPRMGGKEAFLAMRDVGRPLRVLLCSGYSEDAVDALSRVRGFAGFLKKPFNADELQSAIEAALTR